MLYALWVLKVLKIFRLLLLDDEVDILSYFLCKIHLKNLDIVCKTNIRRV